MIPYTDSNTLIRNFIFFNIILDVGLTAKKTCKRESLSEIFLFILSLSFYRNNLDNTIPIIFYFFKVLNLCVHPHLYITKMDLISKAQTTILIHCLSIALANRQTVNISCQKTNYFDSHN